MMTLVMGVYDAMAIGICAILIWSFVREKKSWQKALLYLLSTIPLMIRVLRIS